MKHYLLFYTPTDRNAKISSEQLWKYFPLQTKDCTSCYVSPEHLLGKPNVLWSCFFSLLIGSQGLQWLSKCCPRPRPSSRASWENTASPCICLATPACGIVWNRLPVHEHYGFAQELVTGRDLFAIIQPQVGSPQTSRDTSFIHM